MALIYPVGMWNAATGGGAPAWNPSDKSASLTLSNGNLTATQTVSGSFHSVRSVTGHSSGKWYFEVKITTPGTGPDGLVGIALSTMALSNYYIGQGSDGNGVDVVGAYYVNGGNQSGSSAASYGVNDIVMVAADITAGKIWFGKNGSWVGAQDPAAGLNAVGTGVSAGTWHAAVSPYANSANASYTINSPFTYTPPSGFSGWG